MTTNQNFSYNNWKEYLKTDTEMNTKWKSLTALWKNVKEDLKKALKKIPKSEAMRRRKELTSRNIFYIINTANERLDFSRYKKSIYNEKDGRHEYVIRCYNESSDYLFNKIKGERWVASMQWESIDKYLQPISDKIWALKTAMQTTIRPEISKTDLSYETLKTKAEPAEQLVIPFED